MQMASKRKSDEKQRADVLESRSQGLSAPRLLKKMPPTNAAIGKSVALF